MSWARAAEYLDGGSPSLSGWMTESPMATEHWVRYQTNASHASWAECSCGDRGPRYPGSVADYLRVLDAWADVHEE